MKPLQIAVVGSGISGLSAAWLLSQAHDVTLFEADGRPGGHANTVVCRAHDGEVAIDTGFIVYNEVSYPNLVALFSYLDVPTAETEMGFGVSLDGGRMEYAGGGLVQILGSPGNLIDPCHWQMLAGIARFFNTAAARATTLPEALTLGEFLKAEGYGKAFIDRHLLPMAGAVWSCAPERMLDYSAKAFLRFFDNHGLLKLLGRPKWRTVVGGSREYVNRLVADSCLDVRLNHRVDRVDRDEAGVTIISEGLPSVRFDHVVLAIHGDQALAILSEPAPLEQALLSSFSYSVNRAVLHRDSRLMPKRRRLWSSWNYAGTTERVTSAVTYWMNALQPLPTQTNYFVSLNPKVEPATELVDAAFTYAHPILNTSAMAAQKQLWHLQGLRRTWFCGAHFGSGFHEDGLQSGLAVAEALGGISRPWLVANPSGRIHAGHVPKQRKDSLLGVAE